MCVRRCRKFIHYFNCFESMLVRYCKWSLGLSNGFRIKGGTFQFYCTSTSKRYLNSYRRSARENLPRFPIRMTVRLLSKSSPIRTMKPRLRFPMVSRYSATSNPPSNTSYPPSSGPSPSKVRFIPTSGTYPKRFPRLRNPRRRQKESSSSRLSRNNKSNSNKCSSGVHYKCLPSRSRPRM